MRWFRRRGPLLNPSFEAGVHGWDGGAMDIGYRSPWTQWVLGKIRVPEPTTIGFELSPLALGLLSRLRHNTGIWKALRADEPEALVELREHFNIEVKPWRMPNSYAPDAIMVRLP